jgi:RNA polymerase sigma-70 factor, ECF subfamily
MEPSGAAPLATRDAAFAQSLREPVRSGTAAEFERIMRLYNQRLYRLAFGLVGDAGEAEDILQESYLQAFLHFSSFAGHSSLGAWLASIVRNRAIDYLRARRVRRAAFTLETDLPRDGRGRRDGSMLERAPADVAQSDPVIGRQREETRLVLEKAIALLPIQFRAVFVLREVEGLSLQQTAIYLGIPIATVKTRDHRARHLLRAALGEEFAGDPRQALEFLRERCDGIVAGVLRRLTRP